MNAAAEEPRSSEDEKLSRFLGPGRVLRVTAEWLLVLLGPGTVVRATSAIAFPYCPVAGDQLLIIGSEDAFFAIGVLDGKGQTDLRADVGMGIEADGGWLRLSADGEVRVDAETLSLETTNLAAVADVQIAEFGSLKRVIQGLRHVEAEQVDERSEKGWLLRAARVVVKTVEKVRMKSNALRLG